MISPTFLETSVLVLVVHNLHLVDLLLSTATLIILSRFYGKYGHFLNNPDSGSVGPRSVTLYNNLKGFLNLTGFVVVMVRTPD